MKTGPAVAIGVGAGYLLGRTRKMKLAAMVAAAAATGRMKPGKLLGGSSPLSQLTPELGKLTESVRGGLTEAGKAAALSAASSRIESMTERLHDRAEGLRQKPGTQHDEDEAPEDETAEDDAAEDEVDQQEDSEPDESEEEEEAASPRRRRPAARSGSGSSSRSGSGSRSGSRTGSSSRTGGSARGGSGATKSPVRRTGR
ncbi:MAG: hypothetical protein ACJ73S_11100 [Mycobacteriales bacterium]